MNLDALSRLQTPNTTRAAEGLDERRFTKAELEAMAAAGILSDNERIELVAGEFVLMSQDVLETRRVSSEPQFNVSDDTHYVSDVLVHDAEINTSTQSETVTARHAPALKLRLEDLALRWTPDEKESWSSPRCREQPCLS
ncbi:MAG: hypothetical protein AAFZ01_05160 [Pseudomonadota bacterium]